jgi:site-specific DNA recombinase
MGTTAPQFRGWGTPAWDAGAGPVALAFVGRTSTSTVQNPVESLNRQIRRAHERLPEGFYIARHYWDIESGGTDLDARSRYDVWQQFADAGIPRDGGMADLRAAAASDNPPFSAVICENIERSGRDTFDALKLEKELRARGMVVFATDEPIDVQAAEGSTILVRRMKQGVAEYFRYQLKAQMWEGLRQYVIGGWNTGKTPYGYAAERSAHPNPIKASMGATRARLVPDPETGPWVTRIYEWRVYEKLSCPAIARRLDTAGAPSPDGNGWSPATVARILKNPKYTGRVVLGRTRNAGTGKRKGERKVRAVPRAYWTWADDANRHPELVSMELWEQAQAIGAERGNVRDTEHQTPASRSRTVYPLRARIRCHKCQRRLHGATRPGRTPASHKNVYYLCPHDPANPRHAQADPGHGRVAVKDEIITAALARFMDDYLLGHDRAAMLAVQLPAGAADQAERRDQQAAALRKKLARIKTAQKGLMAQAEQLGDDTSPAANAMRDRIREQFTERYNEHTATKVVLDALTAGHAPAINAPALLDELPYAPGLLADAPATIREALYAAFDIQCLYRHDARQVTIWATITDTTPAIIAALTADPRTDSDTATTASTPPPSLFVDLQSAAIGEVLIHDNDFGYGDADLVRLGRHSGPAGHARPVSEPGRRPGSHFAEKAGKDDAPGSRCAVPASPGRWAPAVSERGGSRRSTPGSAGSGSSRSR